MPLSTAGVEDSTSEKAVSPAVKSQEAVHDASGSVAATGAEQHKLSATNAQEQKPGAVETAELIDKTPTNETINTPVTSATLAANENSEIISRINAMLENTLNLSSLATPTPAPVAKLPFSNEASQGFLNQPLDLSFLAGINPDLYHSIGQTLEAIYPGHSNSNTGASQRGAAFVPSVDSFIPGAISNRTLEHLTESTMRPYRAIRGETRRQTYNNTNDGSTVAATSHGIIGDRGGYLTGGGGAAATSPYHFGGGGSALDSLFKINRSGSPSDSDTSGIGSDLSEAAIIDLMHALHINNQQSQQQQNQQQQQSSAYNLYSNKQQQQQQQQLMYAAAAAAGSAANAQAAAQLEVLKILGIQPESAQQQQQQLQLQQLQQQLQQQQSRSNNNSFLNYHSDNQSQQQLDYSYSSSSNTASTADSAATSAAAAAAAVARGWSALDGLFSTTSTDPYSIERAAKLYRNAATISEPTCTWSGQLPIRIHRNPAYSCKVFLGGVPWDITEAGLQGLFRAFGPLRIEWPGKDGKHPRYPTKGRELPVGYVYVHFDNERSVKALLQACTHDFSNGGEYYYKISSRRMRSKEVQVIPWVLSDSNFVKQPSQRIDPQKTVFVGALHGMLTAEGLAHILNDLFGNVVYAGIDTDKHKYPIGSGRVTFSSHKSYMKAVSAAFVEIKTVKFTKKIQIDPYLEESTCHICTREPGPYFCRDFTCFRYFCRSCWQACHATEATRFHKPLMRNNKSPGFGGSFSAMQVTKGLSGGSTLGLSSNYQQVNPC